MIFLNPVGSSYKRALRLSLLLNFMLIVMAIVVWTQSPAAAVTLRVIGVVDSTTSYRLDVDVNQIVYVSCVSAYGGEAELGYLRNEQALTCPR
jgi:hypothetical protein